MRGRTILRYGLLAGVLVAGTGGVAAYRVLRVEEVPKTLPALPEHTETTPARIEGLGDQPPLDLAAPGPGRTFLLVENQASMRSREGKRLHRALNRWILPEDVRGVVVGDAAGFGFLREKIASMMGAWQKEMRYPVYLDFEGVVLERFSLPKGHTALVVLDADGTVRFRHAGPADETVIEAIRRVLDAREPPPGPPAPAFHVGDLSNERCRGHLCILAFFGAPLERKDVPFLEGGADLEAMGEGAMAYMQRPEIRLATTLVRLPLPDGAQAAVVGKLQGLDEIASKMTVIERDDAARAAFGIEPDQTALFVVDPQGRLAVAETGAFPAYRMGRLEDVLGVEIPRGPGER